MVVIMKDNVTKKRIQSSSLYRYIHVKQKAQKAMKQFFDLTSQRSLQHGEKNFHLTAS